MSSSPRRVRLDEDNLTPQLRSQLADAISRYQEQQERLRKLSELQAQVRLKLNTALHAVDDAREALNKAKETESTDLVDELLGEANNNTISVDAAREALVEARRQRQQLERHKDTLSNEARIRTIELANAKSRRDDAIAMVLRASPSIIALQADLHETRRRCYTLEFTLREISKLSPTALPAYWHALRDPSADKSLAEQYAKAIAELETDPNAVLPGAA